VRRPRGFATEQREKRREEVHRRERRSLGGRKRAQAHWRRRISSRTAVGLQVFDKRFRRNLATLLGKSKGEKER
jgi:hypothetical protein